MVWTKTRNTMNRDTKASAQRPLGREEIQQVERLRKVTSLASAAKHGYKVHSNSLHKGVDATNAIAMVTFDKNALRFALAKRVESAQQVNTETSEAVTIETEQ